MSESAGEPPSESAGEPPSESADEPSRETAAGEPSSEKRQRKISRRALLVGGAAGGTALVAGNYGRFAFGDEFEQHVGSVLGISTAAAKQLTAGAKRRLGAREYDEMAAEFVAVTTFPGSLVAPNRARHRAVTRLLPSMIAESRENLIYLGLQRPGQGLACGGLLSS